MSGKRRWDVTSANSLAHAAEWIRKESGALAVLVIRVEDCGFAYDALVAKLDAVRLLRDELPRMMAHAQQSGASSKGSWVRLEDEAGSREEL